MPEESMRLRRPSEVLENPGVLSARGINRGHLTLYISLAAIVLSVASSGIHLFIYLSGERQKWAAETKLAATQQVKEEALARAAQLDVGLKAQMTRTAHAQELEAIAAAQNHRQDTAKKGFETTIQERQAAVTTEVLSNETIDALGRAAKGTATRNPDLLGIPEYPSRSRGTPPISRGVANSKQVPDEKKPPKFDINQ
jgi:hypothetical protein